MKRIVLLLLIVVPFLSFNSSIESIDIIGTWVGEDKGDVGFMTFDNEGYATFEFQGEILGGKEFIMNGKKGRVTYEINVDKNPIEIDFIITQLESNKQRRILCIAEFEDNNNMIFAMTLESERPIEFNSENSIKLKRTE